VNNETLSTAEKLAALQASYASKLGEKLAELKAAAALIIPGDRSEDSATAILELSGLAHKLSGSAGTFGFKDLGAAAKNLEILCHSLGENALGENGKPVSALERQEIDNLVAAVIRRHGQSADLGQLGLEPPVEESSLYGGGLSEGQTILLVEDDPDQSTRLRIGLSAFGYQIEVIEQLSDVKDALEAHHPAAVILDLEFKEGPTAGAEMIQQLRASSGMNCPLVVLTVHDNFDARLAAVRAGCDQYLTKPASLIDVVHVLDNVTLATEKEPERILVIDDDVDVLEHVKITLQSEGMIVECISDPTSVLKVMESFNPELLLIDLHMPECSGKEVAEIIRQKSEYSGISLVFFSSEQDIDIQYDAMGVGADDFLTKPIDSRLLIPAVRMRVERFRVLQDLMTRDSLTGLYNHATTKQLLETELARARRFDAPVTFSILDIDHFKSINDSYGHRIGDAVIKTLAGILTHRLRKSDIIGRLGDKTFGVVLPNTSGEQALSVIDVIRRAFEEIANSIVGALAPITLSSGLADFPAHKTTFELSEAVELALKDAKNSGRNNTRIAPPAATSALNAKIPSIAAPDTGETQSIEQPSGLRTLKEAIVIDDDPMVAEFIKPFAESAGFHVQTLSDPSTFANIYRANTDLIVLDLNMPVMDGVELIRFLGDNRSEASIIVISGYDQEILTAAKSLARRLNLNVLGALQKPIDPAGLESMLEIAFDNGGDFQRRHDFKGTAELPSVEDLQTAISTNSLEVYFQPKIDLATKSVAGSEALVRWNHPEKGFIPPDFFVTLAEQNELIGGLTDLVLKRVCKHREYLLKEGYSQKVSINISDQSLADLNFPETISVIVNQSGLSSTGVILELTETSLSTGTVYVLDVLTRLRMKGFEISIDDFGTGHSSLARLSQLPFTELKIDKSFVGVMHSDLAARAIVKNTIDLAHSLNLSVVAEGVETQEQMKILESFGCDVAQGYFISRPLPPEDFEAWLKAYPAP
jgi:diguanylate cyclase (GGDEF)-like protein